jgi:hypothetical protein
MLFSAFDLGQLIPGEELYTDVKTILVIALLALPFLAYDGIE